MPKKQKKVVKKSRGSFALRMFVICSVVFSGFFLIGARLFYLQVLNSKEYRKDAEKQYTSKNNIKAKRGRIITNDGETLAYDNELHKIILDPTLLDEDEKIETVLTTFKKFIPKINTIQLKKEIEKNRAKNRRSQELKEVVNYSVYKELSNILAKKISRYSGAVSFQKYYERKYIQNNVFEEMIGFLNVENKGVYGIEKYYDEYLQGTDGYTEGFRNGNRKAFTSIETEKRKKIIEPTVNGNNVVLTVDSILQYALDEAIQKAFNKYEAETAMGILIEVDTGKILAMSSYPKAKNRSEIKNRPIIDFFEPGSIFKPITIAMGLESGVITEYSTVFSEGKIKVADRTIRDHDKTTLGVLSLEKLIANSGNVGMVKIGQMIDDEKFYKYLLDIGFGSKTGVDIFSESAPKLFSSKDLKPLKKANISFGQAISMTQIQMLMALNTVINDGYVLKPYIVDRVEDSEGNIVKQNSPVVVKKIFSDKVSKVNRKLMEAVVLDGTGRGIKIPGYKIGGKTGTAQKAGAKGYEYGKYFSSFYSFFPVDKPKYGILVTINEPKGSSYGAVVALPAVREVLEKLIKHRGINPQGLEVEKEKKIEEIRPLEIKKSVERIKREFENSLMPDLTGLSMREVLIALPTKKYKNYKLKGSGKVVSQFPKHGTILSSNTEIIINFE